MLHQPAIVHASCPVTGNPVQIEVTNAGLPAGMRGFVHFAVPAARWWDDIGYT
jgi:hypothetical protein